MIDRNQVSIADSSFYERFHDRSLLETEYMQRHLQAYHHCIEKNIPLNYHRNYLSVIKYFNEIHDYQEPHARSFLKRIKQQQKDWKQCESVVSEMIVYHSYIQPMYEGLISSISLETGECDVIIERCDGSKYYLEVFCIMPEFPEEGLTEIKTHKHEELSSVRQKLLNKAIKQKQFTRKRENFAVIELNNAVAFDFVLLSSLSGGYNIQFDRKTGRMLEEGYDWEHSVFENPETKFLKGIIWFHMGAYQNRRILMNPYYATDKPN